MRNLLLIALFLNAFLIAGRIFQELPVEARAGTGGAAGKNGDLNGDGERDLSDAVYLLDHLFQGGPAPVALAEEAGMTAEEKEILSHFSLVHLDGFGGDSPRATLRISGVNLQIVNGEGETATANGLGNLIVGYQETRGSPLPDGRDFRTGSHNIVVGERHSYRGSGGLVAGYFNTLLGNYASVSGGFNGTAAGDHSSVGGGLGNYAVGSYSSVSGGYQRTVVQDSGWRAGSLSETQ